MSFADLFRIGDWIRNAWAEAQEYLAGINLYESGAKLLDTFIEGITSRVTAVKESVCSALEGVRNLLPFSDAKEGRFFPVSRYARSVPFIKIIDFLFFDFAVV